PDGTVAFGSVVADGPGGASKSLDLQVSNGGVLPLTISGVSLASGDRGFSLLTQGLAGTVLQPGQSVTLAVSFDPQAAGSWQDTRTVSSDAHATPAFRLTLDGTAIANVPVARLTPLANNNLGGVRLTAPAAQLPALASITNDGAQPLLISAITVTRGPGPFTLLGVPSDLATHPIQLAEGESFTFGIAFAPDQPGLERAAIQISTNDPARPTLQLSAVGTGLGSVVYPDWGHDFVALEMPDNPGAPTLHAVSEDMGNFQFFLAPQR